MPDINNQEDPFLNANDGLAPLREEEQADELEVYLQSKIIGNIEGKFTQADQRREEDEDRWLGAYHNYRGAYGKDVKFRESEKSRVFVKITKTKVLAAYGQLLDILLGNGKFPLNVKETDVPDGIAEHAQLDTPEPPQQPQSTGLDVGYKGDGRELKPGANLSSVSAGEGFLGDLEDKYGGHVTEGNASPIAPTVKPAQEAARAMNKLIGDQLGETNATTALRDSLFEQVLLGTGVVKGPFTDAKERGVWQTDQETGERTYLPTFKKVPRVEHVSLWDFYPDPDARILEDAEWAIQRHKLNRQQMSSLKSKPFFDTEEVDKAVNLGANYVQKDYELEIEAENSNDTRVTDRFEVLEYWGPIEFEEAVEAGLDVEGKDIVDQIFVNVWICNGFVLRITENPFTPNRIPYQMFPYEKNPYSIFGIGVPENMADSQQIMNGHARMAIDNLALAGSLMFDVDESALAPGQTFEIKPGKVFKRAAGMPGQSVYGIKFPNTAVENMQMFDKFRQLADESTGLPSYSHGQTGIQSTTRTAAGMSMLMGAASLNIRTVVKNIDDYLLRPLGEGFYNWNYQFYEGDLPIHGDLDVIATGTSSLMQREVKSQKLLQLLQMVSNPALAPFAKIPNILKEIAITMDIGAEEFISTPEEAAVYAKIMGMVNNPQELPPAQPGAAPGDVPTTAIPGEKGFSGNA